MSLEAIAALLGQRSLDMTLRYAKIASRTVADEYFAVSEKVEALYGQPAQLPAGAAGPKMTRLRREHHRLPGNRRCTRPPQLDCAFESICETCSNSRPASSSGPHSRPSTTTPTPRTRPIGPAYSARSSPTSTRTKHHDPLDTDHPPSELTLSDGEGQGRTRADPPN
jgi:hypothetical protein